MTFARLGKLENADIDSAEDVAIIEVDGMKVLWLEFVITVAALTAFTIEYSLGNDGNWLPMASASGDFTTPNHPVLKASGSLVTASTSGVHWCKLDVAGVRRVRLRAAGNSSNLLGKYSLG